MSIAMSARVLTAPPVRGVVPALVLQEARRLLTHPVMLLGFALFLLAAGDALISNDGPRQNFEAVDSLPSFFPGIFTILAANLVATRDVRAGSDDVLAPLPGRPVERVTALCVAALAPALVTLAAVLAVHGVLLAQGGYEAVPSVWHIVQGPVTVLGGSLFGIMVGTWIPARGAAVLAMVGMVLANVWIANQGNGRLFGPMMAWADWGDGYGVDWAGYLPGDWSWHVVYLVGLCGMAAGAAVVRVADRRTPAVVLGLIALAVAVVGGIGQLP